jgi:hypothetical protein
MQQVRSLEKENRVFLKIRISLEVLPDPTICPVISECRLFQAFEPAANKFFLAIDDIILQVKELVILASELCVQRLL